MRLTENGEPVNGREDLYASAVYDADSSRIIVKIVNTAAVRQEVVLRFDGLKRRQALQDRAPIIYLQADDKEAVNTFKEPEAVVPQMSVAEVSGKECRLTLSPQSFQVISISFVSK